jgi:hypothetical protein
MVLSNRPLEQLEIDEQDRKDMMDTLPDQRYIYPYLLTHRHLFFSPPTDPPYRPGENVKRYQRQ